MALHTLNILTADAASKSSPMREFVARPSSLVFLVVLAVVAIVCFVGPSFGLNPDDTGYAALQAPSAEHLAGTDNLGRDLFARLMVGGRVSIFVGLAVATLCLTVGIAVGGLAGFYGGAIDNVLSRISEFFQVVPSIILALIAVAILGTNLPMIILILGITMWPQVARIVRAECMRIASLGYVESSRAAGFSSLRILWSDVLPNAFPPVLVATTMTVGRAILAESSLSFLGLGDPNTPSWGALLFGAQSYMQSAWWLTLFPGGAIFLIVLSANMLGDRLNDALNPNLGRVK